MAKEIPTQEIKQTVQKKPSKGCYFCTEKKQPAYTDVATLKRFLSDRGKIVAKQRTGVCAKHQRRVSTEIKRARHLALIPFTLNI